MEALAKRLIVSCQASEGDAFRDPGSMARFARAAADGGAAGIRANGPGDVRAIREAVALPVIGIQKRVQADGRLLITPAFEDARALVEAGAAVIALDCTARGRRHGALERLRRIREELRVAVMADIATVEEAMAAAAAGADLVASTMRGYTEETESVQTFEPEFIAEVRRRVTVPVIAEGHIGTPAAAAAAIRAGAFAVIVGTAITRPHVIAAQFAAAIERARTMPRQLVGIDLGGTHTKYAVLSSEGQMQGEGAVATPAGGGRDVLLGHLRSVACRAMEWARANRIEPGALGVATAGWVDPATGRVAYATENLPGWTGTAVAEELERACGLPVAVENDANALAVAERHFGLGRGLDHFVCITLGTGVGGGCYIGGRLNRGAHFFANALGHIPIEHGGLACTCGLRGCLEAYANAAALLRYAGPGFVTAEEVIRAARGGNGAAREALRTYAGYLAAGIVALAHLLDPEMVILAGGIAQENTLLSADIEERLGGALIAAPRRRLRVRISELGYHGGVLGAAAVALEKWDLGR